MPKMICICILLIYFKVISKKRGSLLPPLNLIILTECVPGTRQFNVNDDIN